MARPRDSRSPEFMKLVDHLHDIFTSAELPDVQVTAPIPSAAAQEDQVEPLPMAQSGDILGLLEFLEPREAPATSSRWPHTPMSPSRRCSPP